MVYYGPIFSKKSSKYSKKVLKGLSKNSKWFNKVEIHLKLFQKVGVTAVGVTAVRNNLTFKRS